MNNIKIIRNEYNRKLREQKSSKRIIKGIAGDNNLTRFITKIPEDNIANEKRNQIQPYDDVKVNIDKIDALLNSRKHLLINHQNKEV